MRRRIYTGAILGLVGLLAAVPTASQIGWKVDASRDSIPDRPATGKVAGAKFIVNSAEVVWIPGSTTGNGPKYPSATLTLRQGSEFAVDRSISIFLAPAVGAKLDGFAVQCRPFKFGSGNTKDRPHNSYADGLEIPVVQGVRIEYRTPGQRQFQTAMFQDRYSIALRFGKMTRGRLPGRVFLTMPDTAKSYVVGTFTAVVK